MCKHAFNRLKKQLCTFQITLFASLLYNCQVSFFPQSHFGDSPWILIMLWYSIRKVSKMDVSKTILRILSLILIFQFILLLIPRFLRLLIRKKKTVSFLWGTGWKFLYGFSFSSNKHMLWYFLDKAILRNTHYNYGDNHPFINTL